jgi:hypothetical protein
MSFAVGTSVPVAKSKAEIDAMLARAGARQRFVGTDDARGVAVLGFTLGPPGEPGKARQFRIEIPLPRIEDMPRPRMRRSKSREQLLEQACRERWRVFTLLVKAKLEAISLGITSIEREFLADLVLPDGRSMHQVLESQIAESYQLGAQAGSPMLGTGAGARDR